MGKRRKKNLIGKNEAQVSQVGTKLRRKLYFRTRFPEEAIKSIISYLCASFFVERLRLTSSCELIYFFSAGEGTRETPHFMIDRLASRRVFVKSLADGGAFSSHPADPRGAHRKIYTGISNPA